MKENIEAIGKLGIATIAVCGLIWILHSVVTRNEQLVEALTSQIELTKRQTEALEAIAKTYAGH